MKCVLFARVSTQGQDYEHQLRQLRPVAIANGYADSDIITVEGKESAISLEEEQRETLQEMKEIIEQHPEVNHVFVAAIDRLARRVSIVLNVADYLASRKVNLTFLAPMQMTLLNPDGTRNQGTDMNLMLLAYGAQQEMSIKKARFQSGKAQLEAFTSRYGTDDALKDAYRGAEFGTADFDTKKQLIKQVIKHVTVHKNKQWDYDITVELTDAAQGLSDSVIGLNWHYESKAGKKRLWCGETEISCKGAIAMLKQQRDNAPIPQLPEPPEWAS